MKKHHLVVGTIIGGILLAATMQSASTFALSDTSSTTDAPTSDAPAQTPSSDQTVTPPVDGAVAGGSTATQTDNNTAGVTSTNNAAATDTAPTTTSPATDPTIVNGPTTPPPSDPAGTVTNADTTSGNNTTVTNTIGGTSQSGSATVSNNYRGGDATTGDASGVTTLVNAIASATDLGAGLQTFTLNVNGTQNGNVLLDPNAILSLAGNNNTPAGSFNSDLQNNSTINNNVNLSATSGNANVTDNHRGGDATSGNATTEADIVNLIESLISDQKAFLGVININGTLNGNILLPASVIDQLLKNNGGGLIPNNSNVVATNNMSVNNNVSLSAQTGNASVTNNDHGGDATSGNASTKLNIYNLINSQIVGGNVLLVFVNVMGNWYGLLMNAPAGTTSAALGGGITQSNMGGGDTSVPADQVFTTNNETINNNVTLTSKSGDATVSGNHRGGNATTGDASAVADIVNILGSQINLSGWLGILVINVFGTWNGSLQVQQAAATHGGGPHHHGGHHHSSHHNSGNGYAYYINYASTFEPAVTTAVAHVMGDHTINSNFGNDDQPVAVVFDHTKSNSKAMTDAILAGLAATLAAGAGAARYFNNRKKNQQPPTI